MKIIRILKCDLWWPFFSLSLSLTLCWWQQCPSNQFILFCSATFLSIIHHFVEWNWILTVIHIIYLKFTSFSPNLCVCVCMLLFTFSGIQLQIEYLHIPFEQTIMETITSVSLVYLCKNCLNMLDSFINCAQIC